MRPSKALTFFLSFCPGVGHLYLGAMTRGLQFLIIFFGSISLIGSLPLRIIPFSLPIIWFYCLFDALQIADLEKPEDKPLVEWGHFTKNMHWVGLALIGLGLLMIIDNLLPQLWDTFFGQFNWGSVRTLVMALFFIIVGAVMLRGKKVHKRDRG